MVYKRVEEKKTTRNYHKLMLLLEKDFENSELWTRTNADDHTKFRTV